MWDKKRIERLGAIAIYRRYEIRPAGRKHDTPCHVCKWTVPDKGDLFVKNTSRRRAQRSDRNEKATEEDGHCDTPLKYCLGCFDAECVDRKMIRKFVPNEGGSNNDSDGERETPEPARPAPMQRRRNRRDYGYKKKAAGGNVNSEVMSDDEPEDDDEFDDFIDDDEQIEDEDEDEDESEDEDEDESEDEDDLHHRVNRGESATSSGDEDTEEEDTEEEDDGSGSDDEVVRRGGGSRRNGRRRVLAFEESDSESSDDVDPQSRLRPRRASQKFNLKRGMREDSDDGGDEKCEEEYSESEATESDSEWADDDVAAVDGKVDKFLALMDEVDGEFDGFDSPVAGVAVKRKRESRPDIGAEGARREGTAAAPAPADPVKRNGRLPPVRTSDVLVFSSRREPFHRRDDSQVSRQVCEELGAKEAALTLQLKQVRRKRRSLQRRRPGKAPERERRTVRGRCRSKHVMDSDDNEEVEPNVPTPPQQQLC
tara:strand:- start:405 stop:1850 length:1446 start_codon:yes stop_codon:yes gene_type:complete